MKFIVLILFLIDIKLSQESTCDFDYGQVCLEGLPSFSYVLLNETSEPPRRPASDVTSIITSNDEGECFFPFQVNSFEMYFCEKTDPDLPATCPTLNATGPRINCSEGEYGYHEFNPDEIGSYSYKFFLSKPLESGEHCIEFYYYLSDEKSNASIRVILEDGQFNYNITIVTASEYFSNQWHRLRHDFDIDNNNPTIYFQFERGLSFDSLPYYIAIDEITIVDVPCQPLTTSTTPIINTTSQITTSTSSSTTSITTTTSSSTTLTSSSTTSSTTATNPLTTSSTSVRPSTTTLTSTSTIIITTSQSPTILSTSSTPTTNLLTTTTTKNSSSNQIQWNLFSMIFLFFFL